MYKVSNNKTRSFLQKTLCLGLSIIIAFGSFVWAPIIAEGDSTNTDRFYSGALANHWGRSDIRAYLNGGLGSGYYSTGTHTYETKTPYFKSETSNNTDSKYVSLFTDGEVKNVLYSEVETIDKIKNNTDKYVTKDKFYLPTGIYNKSIASWGSTDISQSSVSEVDKKRVIPSAYFAGDKGENSGDAWLRSAQDTSSYLDRAHFTSRNTFITDGAKVNGYSKGIASLFKVNISSVAFAAFGSATDILNGAAQGSKVMTVDSTGLGDKDVGKLNANYGMYLKSRKDTQFSISDLKNDGGTITFNYKHNGTVQSEDGDKGGNAVLCFYKADSNEKYDVLSLAYAVGTNLNGKAYIDLPNGWKDIDVSDYTVKVWLELDNSSYGFDKATDPQTIPSTRGTDENIRVFSDKMDLGTSWGDLSNVTDQVGSKPTNQRIYFGKQYSDQPMQCWIAGRELEPGSIDVNGNIMTLYQAHTSVQMNFNRSASNYVATDYKGITPLDDITLKNHTDKTAEAFGLPKTVKVITSSGSSNEEIDLPVTWDVDGCSYDKNSIESQNFDVEGSITLPDGMTNQGGLPLTTKVNITVNQRMLESIRIEDEPRIKVYYEGQTFNPIWLSILCRYDNGDTEIVPYEEGDSRFKFNKTVLQLGDTSVELEFEGKKLSIPIEVKPNFLSYIKIKKAPDKTQYNYGDKFDPTGLVLTLVYADQTEELVEYNDQTKGDFRFDPDLDTGLKAGAQSMNVYYKEKGATVALTVNRIANRLEISCDDVIYDGVRGPSPNVTLSPYESASVTYEYKLKGEDDSSYSSTIPTLVGEYVVRATSAQTDNYLSATATANFKISYLPEPESPYKLSGTKGDGEWYTSDVTITPPEGYTISESLGGTYSSSVLVSESTLSTYKVYLKDAEDNMTGPVLVGEIKIDKAVPTGTISIDSESNSWAEMVSKITFGIFFKENKRLSVSGQAGVSGVKGIEYAIIEDATEYTDIDDAKDKWKPYDENDKPALNSNKKYVVFARIKSNAGISKDISTDGIIVDKEKPIINVTYVDESERIKVEEVSNVVSGIDKYIFEDPDGNIVTQNADENYLTARKAGIYKAKVVSRSGIESEQVAVEVKDSDLDHCGVYIPGYESGSWANKDLTILMENRKPDKISVVVTDEDDIVVASGDIETDGVKEFPVDKDGEYYYKFTMKDSLGNDIKSVTYDIKVDKTNPTGTISIENTSNSWTAIVSKITFGLFFNQNQTINIDAQDSLSGVKTVEYAVAENATESTTINDVEGDWETYNKNNKPVLDVNGKYVVYARIRDNAGNTTDLSTDGIIFDKDAPKLDVKYNTESSLITLGVTSFSGVKSVKLTINDEAPIDITDSYEQGYLVKKNAKYKFEVESKAGKLGVSELEVSDIDTLKLSAAVEGSDYTGGTWTNKDVNIQLLNKKSYQVKISYTKNDGTAIQKTLDPNEKIEITESNEGEYTYKFSALDDNNYVTEEESIVVKIDRTPPDVDINLLVPSSLLNGLKNTSDDGFYNTSIEVQIKGSSGQGSDVSKIAYGEIDPSEFDVGALIRSQGNDPTIVDGSEASIKVEDEKSYTISAAAIDEAGNVSDVVTKTFVIDKTAPSVVGIKDGETYYTDRAIIIEDPNLDKVTIDGTDIDISEGYLLEGNVNSDYNIVAKDRAGNEVNYKIKMLTISSIDDMLKGLTKENVTAKDRDLIQKVRSKVLGILEDAESVGASKEQIKELNDILARCDELEKAIDKEDSENSGGDSNDSNTPDKPDKPITPDDSNNPSTGDNSYALIMLSSTILFALSAVVLFKKRKREKDQEE